MPFTLFTHITDAVINYKTHNYITTLSN